MMLEIVRMLIDGVLQSKILKFVHADAVINTADTTNDATDANETNIAGAECYRR